MIFSLRSDDTAVVRPSSQAASRINTVCLNGLSARARRSSP